MNLPNVIGSRIRERRLDQGRRQADVAEAAGISASYLNLIEHNKRRIGGKLLATLADILDVDASTLASGADLAILDGMRAAAARSGHPVEVDRSEDLAARYPGWAELIAAQEIRLDTLESEVQALNDRITHDPALAGALHNVITAVTSIRATAGILVSDDTIDADWQRRFHLNIRDDSRRLAEESKALVSYLDQPKGASASSTVLANFDEAEAFWAKSPELLSKLDDDPSTPIADLFGSFDVAGLSRDARRLLSKRLSQYAADAIMLPLEDLQDAIKTIGLDPAALALQFAVGLPTVLRRLAYLPIQAELPPMGLVVCDGAGAITLLKQTPGFGLNRRATSCPLWPLFSALYQPQQPIRAEVVLPDPGQTRFLCYAVAEFAPVAQFDRPMRIESTMLVVADPQAGGGPVLPVGNTCRICPRTDCAARREPSIVEGIL